MTTYALPNAWERAHQRLAALEAAFDDGTVRVLQRVGVGRGWRCLEVGAGAGSIARWLAGRVGAEGRVLATDIDARFLDPLAAAHPNLEVRRHDIAADELPSGAFDLAHARLVLEHLPARDAALRRMVDALAPGGWLVVESIDFAAEAVDPAVPAEAAALFRRWHEGRTRLLAERGFDLGFARGLARRFRAAGLVEVATEGRAETWWGGAAGPGVFALTVEQLAGPLVEGGLLRHDEAARLRALAADPDFAATSPLVLAVRGRKPAAG